MKVYSPLRYPGGKRKLVPYLERILANNPFRMDHYVEAYAGGAAVALHFLMTNQSEVVHINDLNKSIYAFWYSVLYHTEELCGLINSTPVTLDEWYTQRVLQDSENLLELGFSTFFLNRTNRSGIINGGIIGGFSQTGKYKIDARFGKKRLVEKIKLIASQKDRIVLTKKDALEFMRTDVSKLPVGRTLIYLDPPYFVKGQKLYDNFYQPEDHKAIADYLKSTNYYWLLSYDNCPEVIEMYRGNIQKDIVLPYTAQLKTMGNEIMFFSPNLKPVSQ